MSDVSGANSTRPLLELKNVCRKFGENIAVNNVSFSVAKGDIIGIIGRSGAGKSTLIRCINGLEKLDSGTIYYKGKNSAQLKGEAQREMRRHIAMIFQQFNLLSSRTILDNVALPLKLAGVSKIERHKKARSLLNLVGLTDKALHYPAFLSGGQKQRVGIARALAADPDILLSDEATSALDPETTESILQLLYDINRKIGLTIVLITHEMEVIRSIADKLIVLDKGKIVEQGLVKNIFAHPKNATTRALLKTIMPSLPPSLAEKLTTKGREAVLEFHISGKAASTPFLSDLHKETGATARILGGSMDIIQGEMQGSFFLALNAQDKKKLDHALTWLAHKGDESKVLGYV